LSDSCRCVFGLDITEAGLTENIFRLTVNQTNQALRQNILLLQDGQRHSLS
jgi:hypothetical protein